MDTSTIGPLPHVSPWENRGTWGYSIVNLAFQERPMTHNAFAEMVDSKGEYTGKQLGPFTSRGAAEAAVKRHADEIEAGRVR